MLMPGKQVPNVDWAGGKFENVSLLLACKEAEQNEMPDRRCGYWALGHRSMAVRDRGRGNF